MRFALVAAVFLVGSAVSLGLRPPIFRARTFFGTHRVEEVSDGRGSVAHILKHGTTNHGFQSFLPLHRRSAVSYYHALGPIGDVMSVLGGDDAPRRLGVVGLGSGSMAAYTRPGDRLTFYEIDPVVVRIATDPELFTFIADSRDANAEIEIMLGDARRSLEEPQPEPGARFDMLMIDAFSSDSIPVHLLTVEAIELYLSRLAPRGWLVVHISNRGLDLRPVVLGSIGRLGIAGVERDDVNISERDRSLGRVGSHWCVLARDGDSLAPLLELDDWNTLVPAPGDPVWTDEFSNILGIVRWR